MATDLRQRVRGSDKHQKVASAQTGEVNGDRGLSGFTDRVKAFRLCPTHGSTGNQLRVFIKEYHDTCVFRTAALAARWGMIRSAQGCGPIRTVTVQVQI